MTASPDRIAWAPSARRDLARLPGKVATAVVELVYGSLADDPEGVGSALHLELAGQYAVRRGEYRVVYRIDADESQAVIVSRAVIVAVDHRGDVYLRKRPV